jgi:hypothetical protein
VVVCGFSGNPIPGAFRPFKLTQIIPKFLITLIGLVPALAQSGSRPAPALQIPPLKASLDVDGQPLAITLWGDLSPVPSASPGLFRLNVTGDFSDLQKNLTPLLVAQLNRSDRCGERLSIENASLVPTPPAGILTANLHYERWACAKVLGKQVVKRLVGGNGLVEVRLTPSAGPQGVSLASEVQKIDADGSLGELLRTGSLGDSVREKIAASIQKALQKATDFPSMVPSAAGHTVVIRAMQFADGGTGKLWISLRADAQISAEQFQLLETQLKPR